MAVGALIGGIGSLVGGAVGSSAASKAGGILSAAGSTAATNIGNAGQTAASGVTQAGQAAQAGLTAPTQAAQAGVGAATSGAQAGIATQQGNISPYQQAGQQGVQSLAAALGPNGSISNSLTNQFSFNPSNLQNTPGYQFQLQQGLQANRNQMTASGLGNSGAAVKGANNYATGLAGTYFQNAYNNASNTYQLNRQNTLYQLGALQNLAGIGQNANAQALQGAEYSGNVGLQGAQYQGNVGLQSATQAGQWGLGAATQAGQFGLGSQEAAMQAYMQGQQGAAAGVMGSANAWQNALGGFSNSLSSASALNQIYGGGGSYGGFGGGVMPGTSSPLGGSIDLWGTSGQSPMGSFTGQAPSAYDPTMGLQAP